ncbi:MAG: hypothetical protein U1F98_12070 [Verrucomicrobiota bacterium]
MKVPGFLRRFVEPPPYSTGWAAFALAVAVATDATQILLGPLGWAFLDQALDLMAMILTAWALGFHILLLPTFLLELMPIADWAPTWTGCVLAVVWSRRRAQKLGQENRNPNGFHEIAEKGNVDRTEQR